jgi:hypothetical protein
MARTDDLLWSSSAFLQLDRDSTFCRRAPKGDVMIAVVVVAVATSPMWSLMVERSSRGVFPDMDMSPFKGWHDDREVP